MAHVLTLLSAQSTPYAAFFTFVTDDNSSSLLARSGGTGGVDVNLSALPEGPLKAALTRDLDWAAGKLAQSVTIKMSAAPDGVAPELPLIGSPAVTQSEGITITASTNGIAFASRALTIGRGVELRCAIEIRLIHSSLR